MKRTLRVCAMLFCAMLWFNPAGAQQPTKPLPVDNGTEMKMDKVVQRTPGIRQMAMPNVGLINEALPVTIQENAKPLQLDRDIYNGGLTAEQQLEMVKAYMRNAFAFKPKAGESTAPSIFIASISNATQYFTIADGVVSDPPTRINSLNTGQYYCYPYWGAWCDDHYEAYFICRTSTGLATVGYFAYDFVTDEIESIGLKTNAVLNSFMADYDPVNQKIYTITPGEDAIAIYESTPGTGTFTLAGTLSGVESVAAMAIDKTGKMYIIGRDGNLYIVNKETWVATVVGATGITPHAQYGQSAAVDYRSQKLYWAYINETPELGVATVDVTTGVATTINDDYWQVSQMASVFYVDENPAAVEDFALSYENGKVKAGFTVPALTVNYDAIASLATVEIVKVTESGISQVWSKPNPTPGEEISIELTNLGSNGETVTLAVRVKGTNEAYSDWAIASVLLFNATLPYANGFEEADQTLTNATISAIDPANKGGVGRVNTEHYEGAYSFQISGSYLAGDKRQMVLRGIPVEKGAGYTVSYYIKTDAEEDGVLFAFDGAAFRSYFTAYNDEWIPVELSYVAAATGQMSLTLQGYGDGDGTQFFIDNLSVVQTSSPAAPAAMAINGVTAAANGALQAIVNVTLPDKTMAGDNLAKIDSIVFEYVAPVGGSVDFDLATKVTVKTGLTPGATTNITIPISEAGRYCLRALVYSGEESSPEYAKYGNASGSYLITDWIGSDLPASVKVTATPQTDGTVVLTWPAPTAAHQGYIGTVTYTVKDAAGTQLYSGTDLAFTTAALKLGMHTFTFEMANGIETKTFKVNTLAGIQAGMIYSNVSTAGTTEARVLNVSATAANSAFSQMLYPATGQAMYIDTLLLFATAPETGEAVQNVKIYMGTTDLTAFGGNLIAPAKDFVEKKDLTEVFAGALRFKAGENMLKLPLKGFYYNGTQSLVINIVKPMQEATTFAAAAYVAVSENNMLKYRAVSTEIDFDTVVSYNAYTGTPNGYSVSMVATPGATLKALEVTVTEDGTALENAIITVTRATADNADGKNLTATFNTNSEGKGTFNYMPQGKFAVKVQKAGYIAKIENVTVDANSPATITLAVELIKAKEVKVSGTVQDKGGNKLAGVAVKAVGLADFEATTDNEGAFELQGVYGPGEYELTFEKAGMKQLSVPFILDEKDTVLATPFELGYEVMGVSMASVALEDGQAVVNWETPSVSTLVSWTPAFTQMRRLTIDNKTAFKYAQRFLPADLAALKLGNQPKALRFGFIVGSETANYSIVLASDTTHEIYRAEVPADKLKVGEWCDIEIPAESAAIDITKELWLIVEVSGDNQNYPCAATTTGTLAGKGNLMYFEDEWYQITDLFKNGTGNVLIRLLVEDAASKHEAANGYRVYRGKMQDEFEDYTLLTETTVKTNTYTDAAYATLPFGQYQYAVVADWYGDDLSAPTYTSVLNKDMEFTVRFKVTSNAGSAKDAYVYLIDTARTRDYDAVADDNGAAVMTKVWRDVYNYEISLDCHQTARGELNLTQDTVIEVALLETILNPELTVEVAGKDVVMNYGVNLHNWFDDVESYSDFAIANIGDYILSEPVQKGGMQDVTWTNVGEKQSWMVFNPTKTQPAITSLPGHSGDKMFAAFYNANGQNNDYLIRPVSKGGGVFIFYCKVNSASYPEAFEVVYSSTTADLSAFKKVKAYDKVSVTSWTPVVVEIPESAKYIGIHCTSNDAFALYVDDLAYYTEDPAKPTGYELYLDGTKVKDAKVDELSYTFKDVAFGTHKVGVKAIYASGASEMVEKTVKVSAEAMPINLNVAVDKGTAVLTWKMPEGFTPKSYQVFLGKDKVAENLTDMTYTFTDLKNGKYTAAVVAVYETGESEKATVDFQVTGVDNELVSLLSQSYIYPNPNNGTFYLYTEVLGYAEVYSLTGKKMQHMVIPAAGTYAFNLLSAQGMYVVRFVSGGETRFFKVIVR